MTVTFSCWPLSLYESQVEKDVFRISGSSLEMDGHNWHWMYRGGLLIFLPQGSLSSGIQFLNLFKVNLRCKLKSWSKPKVWTHNGLSLWLGWNTPEYSLDFHSEEKGDLPTPGVVIALSCWAQGLWYRRRKCWLYPTVDTSCFVL